MGSLPKDFLYKTSINGDSFTFPLPLDSFSFFYLVTMSRTSYIMLNESGENGQSVSVRVGFKHNWVSFSSSLSISLRLPGRTGLVQGHT